MQPHAAAIVATGYTAEYWTAGVFNSYFSRCANNSLLNPSRADVNHLSKPSNDRSFKSTIRLPVQRVTKKISSARVEAYVDNILGEDVCLPTVPGSPFFAQNTPLPSLDVRF